MATYLLSTGTILSTLCKMGYYSYSYILGNPTAAKLAVTVAAPSVTAIFVKEHLSNLFPGAKILYNTAYTASALGPLLLISPESYAVALGGYLLLIGLKEGGILAVRFTAKATYEAIKYLLTTKQPVNLEELNLENWELLPIDSKKSLLNSSDGVEEFEFLEGSQMDKIMETLKGEIKEIEVYNKYDNEPMSFVEVPKD